MKDRIIFLLAFSIVPNTITFWYLTDYFNPVLAYAIACLIWGNILYEWNMNKFRGLARLRLR